MDDHSMHMHGGHDHSHMQLANMGMGAQDHSMMMTITADGGDSPAQGFCQGEMGMVMYMEGFQWTLAENSSCINLFFSSWTLNTKWKLFLAMLGIFGLAALTEGISRVRHQLFKKARSASQDEHSKYSLLQTSLHGLHALMGYMLMLATMTFSLELFFSVILGLVFGYVLFGGDEQTHVATNPCCAFLEDETVHQPTGTTFSSATNNTNYSTMNSSATGSCCDPTSTTNVDQIQNADPTGAAVLSGATDDV